MQLHRLPRLLIGSKRRDRDRRAPQPGRRLQPAASLLLPDRHQERGKVIPPPARGRLKTLPIRPGLRPRLHHHRRQRKQRRQDRPIRQPPRQPRPPTARRGPPHRPRQPLRLLRPLHRCLPRRHRRHRCGPPLARLCLRQTARKVCVRGRHPILLPSSLTKRMMSQSWKTSILMRMRMRNRKRRLAPALASRRHIAVASKIL